MRIPRELIAQWQITEDKNALNDALIEPRDYAGLQCQDVQLRLWLPDQARIGLEEVCLRLGVSMTVYLTEFFAAYLFGVHEMLRMRDNGSGLYAENDANMEEDSDDYGASCDREEEDEPEFDDPVPEMGKNIFALKIFLPGIIKAGLQRRANVAGVPLGRFVRAMICAHLFGRNIGTRALMGQVARE